MYAFYLDSQKDKQLFHYRRRNTDTVPMSPSPDYANSTPAANSLQ